MRRFARSLGRIANRDQADRPYMIGQAQNSYHFDRIIGTNKTSTQVLFHNAQQNQQRGKRGIDQTIKISPATIPSSHALCIGTGRNNQRSGRYRGLAEGRCGQLSAYLGVLDKDELPGLEITRTRRTNRVFEKTLDNLFWNRLIRIGTNHRPALDNRGKRGRLGGHGLSRLSWGPGQYKNGAGALEQLAAGDFEWH